MREVVHLSLGSQACAVTAHWSNLQGLAATSADEDGEAHCQASVTHAVHQEVYVPRMLLVDTPAVFATTAPPQVDTSSLSVPTWNGSVERLEQESNFTPRSDALTNFFSTASTLAFSPYSRYRAPQQQTSTAFQSSGRHVVWEEEEEPDEEEDEDVVEEQRRRQERQWQNSFPSMQTSLDQYWNPPEATETAQEGATQELTHPATAVSWMDYYMPPYRPSSCLALPFAANVGAENDWDSYQAGLANSDSSILKEWKEEELLESLRVILEDCDACQGFVLTTSGSGLTAGLTTMLLQQAAEESPSSRRWVVSLQDKSDLAASASSWHETGIQRVRSHVQAGLALQHFAEGAHAVLPLQWPKNLNSFQASATLAAHLEVATLPYRLRGSEASMVGLNAPYYGTYNGDFSFGTAPHLSFSEFVKSLVPSPSHSILELNGLLPGAIDDLWPRLEQGTSLERDRRMRDPHQSGTRRPRDVLPGQWMLDRHEQQHPDDGLLTSLSLLESQTTDRSSHKHYALSTALRRADARVTKGQYATALMEGMGICYRPEQSVVTVLDQSLSELVRHGYAAGSYWKSVWKGSPVLAALGNSTRIHPLLRETAHNMEMALSPKCRGYLNRDVQSGLLPELEDCQEAVAGCLDMGDAYEPSGGFDEGSYLDDF